MPIYLQNEMTSDFWPTPVTDHGSGATRGISFWKARIENVSWSMLGMTAEPNYNNAPSVSQNIYRSVGDGFDGLTYARGFTQVWISDNSKHSSKLGIYMPKAPDGYIALGCVAVSDYRYPPVTPYSLLACVRQDLCEQVTLSSETNLIWTDENSGSSQNVSVWMLPTAQTCVATVQQSGYPSSVVVWDVKKPATAA